MEYYSGRGDKGKTDIANKRIGKDKDVIELIGTLDELNAFIGFTLSKIKYEDVRNMLKKTERAIYIISACASGYAALVKREKVELVKKDVEDLENDIKSISNETDDIVKFIYPNGSESACALNVCRTLARKAERRAIKAKIKNEYILAYLNRLSSLLFVLLRTANKRDGVKEEFF